eukprot:ctg_1899.g572
MGEAGGRVARRAGGRASTQRSRAPGAERERARGLPRKAASMRSSSLSHIARESSPLAMEGNTGVRGTRERERRLGSPDLCTTPTTRATFTYAALAMRSSAHRPSVRPDDFLSSAGGPLGAAVGGVRPGAVAHGGRSGRGAKARLHQAGVRRAIGEDGRAGGTAAHGRHRAAPQVAAAAAGSQRREERHGGGACGHWRRRGVHLVWRPGEYVYALRPITGLECQSAIEERRRRERLQGVCAGSVRRVRILQTQVRGGCAPGAAGAGHRSARPRAHLHRHRGHHARGRRGGGDHRPEGRGDADGALRRRRRPERQQGGDGGGPVPSPHRHPGVLHRGAESTEESRARHADPARQTFRNPTQREAREGGGAAALAGGHRCAQRKDPHLQLQRRAGDGPSHRAELSAAGGAGGQPGVDGGGMHLPGPAATHR